MCYTITKRGDSMRFYNKDSSNYNYFKIYIFDKVYYG